MTPTRTARLWLDNDESLYRATLELVAAHADDEEPHDLADALEDWAESLVVCPVVERMGASMTTDLLQHAFSAIDWREIAASYLEDARQGAA